MRSLSDSHLSYRDLVSIKDDAEDELLSANDALSDARTILLDAERDGARDNDIEVLRSNVAYAVRQLDESALPQLIRELDDVISDISDGDELIAEHAFEQHAMDIADSMMSGDTLNGWPCTCIDWKRAADDLSSDYTSYTIDGHTFFVQR